MLRVHFMQSFMFTLREQIPSYVQTRSGDLVDLCPCRGPIRLPSAGRFTRKFFERVTLPPRPVWLELLGLGSLRTSDARGPTSPLVKYCFEPKEDGKCGAHL